MKHAFPKETLAKRNPTSQATSLKKRSPTLFLTIALCCMLAGDQAILAIENIDDWLVQNVCVADPRQDPFSCGASTNNSSGVLYYVRMSAQNHSSNASIKVKAYNGSDRYFNLKDFNYTWDVINQQTGQVLTGVLEYNPIYSYPPAGWDDTRAHDGYDNLEAFGAWVSIINTRGPGHTQDFSGTRPHSNDPNCYTDANDAWLLFNTYETQQNNTINLQGIRDFESGLNAPCSTAVKTRYWLEPNMAFKTEGGGTKVMDALVVEHWAGTAVEKFYFTKLYGFTKWEAFTGQPNPETNAACSDTVKYPGTGGSTNCINWDSTTACRVDCSDWATVKPLPVWSQGYDVSAYFAPYGDLRVNNGHDNSQQPGEVAALNMLRNADFGYKTWNHGDWWTHFGGGAVAEYYYYGPDGKPNSVFGLQGSATDNTIGTNPLGCAQISQIDGWAAPRTIKYGLEAQPSSAGQIINFRVEFWTANFASWIGYASSGNVSIPLGRTWQSRTASVPANAAYICYYATADTTSGTVWLDNMFVRANVW